MDNEFTTYHMQEALASFVKGKDVFVCHPDENNALMLSKKDIKDAKGHLFLIQNSHTSLFTNIL